MERSPNRYYGLDAVRALMLLLGVVLHLAIPYTGFPASGFFVAEERSKLLKITVVFIHYFRMPAFFLLSGFFSALLWKRHGALEFFRRRFRRIGVVWIVAMLVLTPVIAAISVYSHFVTERGDPLGKSIDAIASWKVDSKWLQPAPLHLWFLEYLMLYCAVATLLLPRIEGFLPKLDSWTWAIVNSRFRLAVLAMPTAISFWMMPAGMARYPDSLVPALDLIVMYGWFYVVGWLIYRRRDLLTLLASRAKAEVLTCPLFVVCALLLLMARGILGIEVKARSLDFAISLSISLFIWSFILILLSAAIFLHRPNRIVQYLADASYWVYLSHFPLTCLMPALLRDWPVAPFLKVIFSTVFINVLLLLVYHRLIRYSALGRALNGVRLRTTENVLSRAAVAGS